MKRASLFVMIVGAAVAGVALAAPGPATSAKTCEVDDLLAHTRGLEHRSPAYRKYMQRLLREAATDLPEGELLAAFAAEHDPARLEMLAAALAARTDRSGEPGALRAVAARAVDDTDPRARAAATRALRGTSTLEHSPDIYKRLVHDPSPEVRREAAENLVIDNESVFGGQHGPAAETAVAAAVSSKDPAVTARVLGNVRRACSARSRARAPRSAVRRSSRSAACPPARRPLRVSRCSRCIARTAKRASASRSSRASRASDLHQRSPTSSRCAASTRRWRSRSTNGSRSYVSVCRNGA
jgi:hypothetical protein